MDIPIGELKLQKSSEFGDYKAFVPHPFPPKDGFNLSHKLILKADEATRLIGKLDGITELLPDLDFFLTMYVRKDAASSSQIEGTMATMIDAIEAESKTKEGLPEDVDDITHYIGALNYGLKRLKDLPLSLRLIKEMHKQLMEGARSTHFANPGEFRSSQNWIKGTTPANAKFVPPPAGNMKNALDDLEKFIHDERYLTPIIKAAFIHGQFETIHPFLDGNGRTGRMIITLYFSLSNLLEHPVLFLASFFKQHQDLYYEKIDGYHNGKVEAWVDFFLDGVINVSKQAIETVKAITSLRESDLLKIQSLGKTASESATMILPKLYKLPIVNVAQIQEWTGFSRQGAQNVIDRFVELGILELKDESVTYGRSYIYRKYVDIFSDKQ